MSENLCGTCCAPVFQAEGIPAGGKLYHKVCYKCRICGKLLSTNSSHLHNAKLHCRTCHSQVTRPPSPALFSDTARIKPSKDEAACPECGGCVYEAEKVVEDGKVFHRRCFICCRCRRPQDDKLQVFVGFDKKVYCAACYPKVQHTPLPGDPNPGRIQAPEGGGCPRCGGKVFDAERKTTRSGVYHQQCFTCTQCSRSLDYSTAVDHQKNVYCTPCYRRYFDERSRSAGPPNTSTIKGEEGNNCPRCEGAVFEAEKVISRRHLYHRGCLSCLHCKASLSPANFFDAPDGEVYCKACYAVLFGHRRAKSMGPSDSKISKASAGDPSGCLICGGKVYEAEKVMAGGGRCYHLACCKCVRCSVLLDSNTFNSGPGGVLLCNGCFKKERLTPNGGQQEYVKSMMETTSIPGTGGDGCPRCGGKVFEAEKMVAGAGVFHRRCFACYDCGRLMHYFMACDGPNSDLYCKGCYRKRFHISELRVSEADKARDTSILKPVDQSKGCPRCSGSVFQPEELRVKDKSYHKRCATCLTCSAQLDSLSLTLGQSGQLYCRPCHTNQHRLLTARCTTPDPTRHAEGGGGGGTGTDACFKCGGRVYEMERIASSELTVYHKACFACYGCRRKLDSTLVYSYQAPDNQIYCKKCYTERFDGEGTTPLVWSDTTTIRPVDGQGCPRCGGAVFKAEEVIEKGRNFHTRCFTCRKCARPLGDKLQVYVGGEDSDVYCKLCYATVKATPADQPKPGLTTSIPGEEGRADRCPRCGGKVFEAEKVAASPTTLFHTACFSCVRCKSCLSLSGFCQGSSVSPSGFKAGEVFCKTCYIKEFFSGGKNFYLDYSKITGNTEDNPQGCPRCGAEVYEAEKVMARGGQYHRKCLSCHDCKRSLDSSSFFDGRDGHIYCRGCYNTKFGPLTRPGSGLGEAELAYFPAGEGDLNKCQGCAGKVFEAERLVTSFGSYHRTCFKCYDCSRVLDTTPGYKFNDNNIYCKSCMGRARERLRECGEEVSSLIAAKAAVETTSIMAGEKDLNGCPRCGGKVYEAEKQEIDGKTYHRNCFYCDMCRAQLDLSLACSTREGVVCRNCYSKVNNSITIDTSTTINTASIKPSGDQKGCPRCGGAVFQAEEVLAKGFPYHRKCLSCLDCQTKLDRSSFFSGHGQDCEIYCKICYSRRYGGCGYRGALTGTWVDANTSNNFRPATPVDKKSIRAQAGEESCVRCGGRVFLTEMFRTKTGTFHKSCFSCRDCSRSLESTLAHTVIGPDKEVYCKKCHGERFGLDNAPSLADPKLIAAVDGDGCHRCNGKVFSVELIVEKGKNYHAACFACKTCKRPLTDKLQVFSNADGEVYCKTCCPKVQHTPVGLNTDTSVIKGESDMSCPRCEGAVFEAEKMQTSKMIFHKKCFSCRQCKHLLDYKTMNEDKHGEVFCKSCYLNLYFTAGKNSYLDKSLVSAQEDDPNACLVCRGKVFETEKILAKFGVLHMSCLSCINCSRSLNTSNFFNGPDRGIYCKNCYSVVHGHRARSRSRGPVDYTQFKTDEDDPQQCRGCGGKIFEAERFPTCFGPFHTPCFKCTNCNQSLLTSPDSACCRNGKILCRQCFGRERSHSRHAGHDEDGFLVYAKSIADSHVIKAADGDPDQCPRCSGKVYDAERMSMTSGQYHKKCFSCFECRRPIDYTIATDGPDNQVYCRSCYGKNFGPQSFKTEVDSVYKTDTIKAADGCGCPRCGGAVFDAEKVNCGEVSYHKKCAKCRTCNTMLGARTMCLGFDKEIYCNGCYGRKFGGATYRGAQTQNWVDGSNQMENGNNLKINANPDDPEACKRCFGKVYELEKITCKNGNWHKFCFYCNGCRTSLNSTLVMAFEAPDNQIYCKRCYTEAFGEGQSPLIYIDVSKVKKCVDSEDACVRCSTVVYEAEKVRISNKLLFHKFCFTCARCKGALDAMKLHTGPAGEVFCTTCYRQILDSERTVTYAKSDSIKADPGDRQACPRCGGKVFESEKCSTKSNWFHKGCFSCKLCNHKLELSTYIDGPNSEVFCKTCYNREFNSNSQHRFGDKSGVKAEHGDKEACLNCGNKVYLVDKVLAGNGLYHKYCLTCDKCKIGLNTSTIFTNQGTKIYCKNCYNENFGVRGRSGSFSGPKSNGIVQADENDPSRCPRCGGKVYEAEKMMTSNGPFHPRCFSCNRCDRNLDLASCHSGGDGEIYCNLCYREEFGIHSRRSSSRARARANSRPPSRNRMRSRSNSVVNLDDEEGNRIIVQSMVNTTSIPAEEGDRDQCPKCGGKVFEAEKIVSGNGNYHRRCFSCQECSRRLDSYTYCNGPNKTLFCRNCYDKNHGPSVRNFSEEEAKKFLVSMNQEAENRQKACPRCRCAVYPNEELYSNGRSYHKKCSTCASCARQLDFHSIFDGSDKDIYCKGCYGRKFGVAGYRGILSSTWADEEAGLAARPSINTINTNIIQTQDPAVACLRCSGRVFEAEKMVTSHGLFHKTCFRCADCSKSLDSITASNGPDKQVYCRGCYGKLFGLHGFNFGGLGSSNGETTVQQYHFTSFF